MKPVLSRAQMRAFDAHAITQCSVPGVVLMENAGRGATDVLVRELYGGDVRGARPVVVCGAGEQRRRRPRHRAPPAVRGASPVVFFAGDADRVTGDVQVNFDAWRGIGGEVQWLPPGAPLSIAARGARARRSRDRRAVRHGSRPAHRGLAGRRRARDERVAGTSIRGRPSVGARRRHGRGARRRGRGEGDGDVRALQAWPPHAQRREPRRARARRRHRRPAVARDARRKRAAAARAGGPRCVPRGATARGAQDVRRSRGRRRGLGRQGRGAAARRRAARCAPGPESPPS